MDLWSKARSFAEEAAKKSQELTKEAAKRSQELTSTISAARFTDIVSETAKKSKELTGIVVETAKKSKELAAEASTHIKAEALKRADQIKSLSLLDHSLQLPLTLPVSLSPGSENKTQVDPDELERYGVTDDLREFVKTVGISTFQDFPLQDDGSVSDIPTVANVQQDLTDWQARHATLVLSTVKEVSKLRFELCPRMMKERKFWRIYFMLVNSHVTAYEKKYMEAKLKSAEQDKDAKGNDPREAATMPLKKATSAAEQDLDVFLLGDLGDSDEGPDAGDDGLDDDFDKIHESLEDELSQDTKESSQLAVGTWSGLRR